MGASRFPTAWQVRPIGLVVEPSSLREAWLLISQSKQLFKTIALVLTDHAVVLRLKGVPAIQEVIVRGLRRGEARTTIKVRARSRSHHRWDAG